MKPQALLQAGTTDKRCKKRFQQQKGKKQAAN